MPNHVTHAVGDEVCVTSFRHGRHVYAGFTVHHTDMSHEMGDGAVYGERTDVWLTPDQIAVRGSHCLRRHLQRQ